MSNILPSFEENIINFGDTKRERSREKMKIVNLLNIKVTGINSLYNVGENNLKQIKVEINNLKVIHDNYKVVRLLIGFIRHVETIEMMVANS